MFDFFTSFDIVDTFKASMVLFAVIDIIGSIPIILKIKNDSGEIHAAYTSVVALGLLIGFLILGESILALFGVNIESFAVAGALILFIMSFEMILGVNLFRDNSVGKTASIVPLAFPIIAGAGSMTTIVSLRAEYDAINIVMAIVVNIIIVYLVLKSTKRLEVILGLGGIAILKKVFGIILLAIAVKLFSTNVQQLFN
jgi:multiple antibiotic resistance protein